MSFDLPEDVVKELAEGAARMGIPVAEVLQHAVRIGIEEMKAADYNLDYVALHQAARNAWIAKAVGAEHGLDPDPLPLKAVPFRWPDATN